MGMAASAQARTLRVGPGEAYAIPSAAIAAARSGDTVQIAAGAYTDCATVTANGVTIAGAGPTTILTGRVCAGKGLLNIDGDNITVRDLTLQGARAPEHNGAGIRAEGGNLTVDGVRFVGNENGILSADAPAATIAIRDSVFLRNGSCVSACAHGVYAGHIALLSIENSRFEETRSGHHVKSRALVTRITGTTIEDGPNGTSSYLVEIPNGGSLIMEHDVLEKGPGSENHAVAISIGAEGVTQRTDRISIHTTSFRNDQGRATVFLRNLTGTRPEISGVGTSGMVTLVEGTGAAR